MGLDNVLRSYGGAVAPPVVIPRRHGDVVAQVVERIIDEAGVARARRILDAAARAERGGANVTWLTGMSKEERRERLFGKMPRS